MTLVDTAALRTPLCDRLGIDVPRTAVWWGVDSAQPGPNRRDHIA